MNAKPKNPRPIKKIKEFSKKRSKKTRLKGELVEENANPRVTSDTVAEHREQILSGARRFKNPLQQTKNRVVAISAMIIVAVFIGSMLFSGLLLYRYQSTSNFAYRISQLVPFPISKVDGDYIAYEDYLFELSYSLFYYQNYDQEGVDINSSEGDQLTKELKTQALEKIKLDKVAKKLAEENGIEITRDQINHQIDLIRNQGGIGESDVVLEEILRSSYNWNINDLERTIRLQLVRQSLPGVLDTKTIETANKVKKELDSGSKFVDLAKKYSDDPLTKDAKGVIGLISKTDTFLPPEFIDAAFELEAGEVSDLVESRFGLHLIRINKIEGDEREVAHILFNYFDTEKFLKEKLAELEVTDYITIK